MNDYLKIDGALKLIRTLQPQVTRQFHYHIALGGGVLNAGFSDKDLDLYFIPFSELGPKPVELITYLESRLGQAYNLGGPEVLPEDVHRAYPNEPTWINGRYTFRPLEGRIDVFIA